MPGEKRIALDPRLSMIAQLVGSCECLADIGCDHGRLGAFMLQNHRCKRAQLTDISDMSLKKARSLIALAGLSEFVDFCVGDGAKALIAPCDVAVVAGMGGTTIAQIIRDGRDALGSARLVLQPNVAVPELREALWGEGYGITDERVVQDGRRNYVILVAEVNNRPKSAITDHSLKEKIVGGVLLERMPPELSPYAQFRLRVARKALKGAEAGGDGEQAALLSQEIEIWEEVLSCL